jgi:hypothetical protein
MGVKTDVAKKRPLNRVSTASEGSKGILTALAKQHRGLKESDWSQEDVATKPLERPGVAATISALGMLSE